MPHPPFADVPFVEEADIPDQTPQRPIRHPAAADPSDHSRLLKRLRQQREVIERLRAANTRLQEENATRHAAYLAGSSTTQEQMIGQVSERNPDLSACYDPGRLAAAFYISLTNKFVYCTTPKAGCSSVKLTLSRLELQDADLTFGSAKAVHNRRLTPMLVASQVSPIRNYFADATFFTFCFVRNPFTRTLSAYLDKIVPDPSMWAQIRLAVGTVDRTGLGAVTFLEFLRYIDQQTDDQRDVHWSVQWHHTLQAHLRYRMIRCFETFDQDLRHVIDQIRPGSARFIASERRHSTGADAFLNDFYDARAAELVRKIYQRDFEGFAYGPDVPVPA